MPTYAADTKSDMPAQELPTVDLLNVDLMAAGERVWGRGSPTEGDLYDEAKLREMAAASNAVVDLAKPPNKLSHSMAQRLVTNTGITDGEQPALGWLRNFRVGKDPAGRAKLYADILKVPEKFARLIRAGAFRTRSAEIGPFTAHGDNGDTKTYDAVVRGLAWHGAKASAFQTLDDIVALFESAEEIEQLGEYEPTQEEDVAVIDTQLGDEPPQVVTVRQPFTVTVDDTTYGEEEVEALVRAAVSVEPPAADTKSEMADETAITEEQVVRLRTIFGLAEDADLDAIFSAAETTVEKANAEPPAEDDNLVKLTQDEVNELRAKAERGDKAFEDARVAKRDKLLADAVKDGKIEPSQVEDLARQYDETPEMIERSITALPVNEEFLRTYGSDDNGVEPDAEAEDKLYEAYVASTGGDL